MSESIAITITNVEPNDEGVRVACVWRQGDREPVEMYANLYDWPESADDVRAMLSGWVLMSAHDAHRLRLLQNELMGNGWVFDFDPDADPEEQIPVETRERFDRMSSIERK